MDVVVVYPLKNSAFRYRVENYHLAVIKHMEYVIDDEWYVVPRSQWTSTNQQNKLSVETFESGTAGNTESIHKHNTANPLSPQSNFERIDLDRESSSPETDHEDVTIEYEVDSPRTTETSTSCRGEVRMTGRGQPISKLQWFLMLTFCVSLQLCVLFSTWDTDEIERNDVSGPPH